MQSSASHETVNSGAQKPINTTSNISTQSAQQPNHPTSSSVPTSTLPCHPADSGGVVMDRGILARLPLPQIESMPLVCRHAKGSAALLRERKKFPVSCGTLRYERHHTQHRGGERHPRTSRIPSELLQRGTLCTSFEAKR